MKSWIGFLAVLALGAALMMAFIIFDTPMGGG